MSSSILRQLFIFILVTIGLAACQFQQFITTKPKELYCPPPLQNCKPDTWSGIPFDTISTKPTISGNYLKIQPVVLINSPKDEWGVSFYSTKEAVQTLSDDSSMQFMRLVRFKAPEIATVENILSNQIAGSFGGLSSRSSTSVMSGLPNENLPGDASIYLIDFKSKQITDPTVINEPISRYRNWDAQPTLTSDGKVMFFASDREGGFGGTDIWFSINKNGMWSSPVNCGERVNSRCDELTPFVTLDDKRLLFSSAGHSTVGGYDIFTSDISYSFNEYIQSETRESSFLPSMFSEAKNYGMPLNTKDDELFPSSPAGTDTLLYYSSNQLPPNEISPQQKGKFDVYVLHKLWFVKDKTITQNIKDAPVRNQQTTESINSPLITTATIDGKVVNSTTKQPVENADVTVKELPSQTIVDQTKTDSNGYYSVIVPTMTELEISAQNEDLFYDSHKIRLNPNDSALKFTQNFSLPDKLYLRINFPSDVFDNPYQFVLDSNGTETNQTFTESLDLLAQNLVKFKDKIKKLMLIGHTDDVASDAYNMALGRRRVEFVATELTKRGVPKAMLDTKSVGESQPLAARKNEDIEVYRKRLRRVELQKIMR